jgi:predicted dehydrogenase
MDEVKLGLIGVGPMAALHAQAIAEVERLRIDTCVSRSADRASAFAQAHGVRQGRVLEEFLARPDVDALWVVAPADAMAEVAVQLSALGLPMFLEKPVGLSLEETQRVRQAVAVPNMVGLNRRFYEVVQHGLRLAEQAGGVRAVEVHMPEDVGPHAPPNAPAIQAQWQFANSVHLIDLFRLFAGEPAAIRSANEVRSRADRSFASLIAFEGGASGIYNAQWYAPGRWRVTIYADDLCLVYEPIEQLTVIRRPRAIEVIKPTGADARVKAGLAGQAAAFGDLVRTGRLAPHAADLADYEKSVALVDALTRTGQGIG